MAARTREGQTPETAAETAEASATSPETPNTPALPADAPEHTQHVPAATSDSGDKKTVVTHVWSPAGPVPKASVLQTAIQSVRDAIPVVFELEAEITGANKKQVEGQDGTEFEVTITYTPRKVAGGKEEPVDVDKVIKGLDVPRSLDGISGVDGDPEFHARQPTEL